MLRRRDFFVSWLASVLIAAALVLGGPGRARADEFEEGAKNFIKAMSADASLMLMVKDISRSERAERFRTLMNKNFAMKGIAKFVLGRHWRKASEAQKEEYLRLFEDLMVSTYADRFESYSGEKLLIKRAEIRGKKDAIVHTTMVKADNATKPLKVAWRVRIKGETFTIIDVMVEGISMIMTQKSEFASFIKQNGGTLDALLLELKKRVQDNS
jgi:phospholipid transport system substrate-binding protein